MKLLHKAIYCVAVATALTGCEMKNELIGNDTEKREMGTLELGVAVKLPLSQTRATVETDNFPVTVEGISTDVADIKREYTTAKEVPASITLPVGNYKVTAHSPGELQKQMTQPYYGGEATMEIQKDITTETKVECKMKNSRIQINYGNDFITSFSAWTITINDGNDSATAFTANDLTPAPIYWAFDEGKVTTLTVDITATLKAGGTIRDSKTFIKAAASEKYDDVSDFFEGGDAIDINMGTAPSAEGNLTGITITTNVTFENKNETVEIPVNTPTIPTDPDPTDPPTDPDTPTKELTVELPDDITFSLKDEDLPSAIAKITAPATLKTMNVKIIPGNVGFAEALEMTTALGMNFVVDNANDAGGCNLIENAISFNALMASVGAEVVAPTTEDTYYEFAVHSFFSFMTEPNNGVGEKPHEFIIEVTDDNGKTVSDSFKITITE